MSRWTYRFVAFEGFAAQPSATRTIASGRLKLYNYLKVAYLFLGYIPEMTALYRDLQNWGYTIIFKPTLRNGDDEVKGNCDAELVLQAMIDLKAYERAVIVTGDGDFACLVSYLKRENRLERLVSPNHERCSLLLKRIVPDNHLFLNRFKERLEHKPSK